MALFIGFLSIALAVAWIPVGMFFWRAWRARGAPLSLAICGLIGFPIYTNASAWVFLNNDPIWVVGALAFVNALVLSNFYLCFRWQKKSFPDARTSPPSGKPRFWKSN